MAAAKCCVHILENENGKIIPISEKSKSKIILCKDKWISLDGEEKFVSEALNDLLPFNTNSNLGYHKKCYARFTDKTRILNAEKRKEKNTLDKYSKRSRRSLTCSFNVSGIFPNNCLLCEKEKFVYENVSRKRNREKLAQCMTFNASNTLLEAAIKKNDDHILTKIRGVDLIAKEAKYHKSCYLKYTKFLKNVNEDDNANPLHKDAYKLFCESVIVSRILNNSEVLQMTKLSKILKEIILKNNPSDVTDIVSNRQLKRWLQRDYPQLVFVKPKQRNISELVLNSNISDDAAVVFLDLNETESTETEEMSSFTYADEKVSHSYDNEAKGFIYKSALILRQHIAQSPSLDCMWPPTADNLKPETAEKMIPTLLFNFLAWCIGETDDVEFEHFIAVSDSTKSKIFSIAQDILYLASAGRKQTPKHLSLAMAIRHITGCSKITDILNGLGHCISHSALLEYDTALAEMQLNSLHSLPPGIQCKKFSTLVWDNIDFSEETATGHGTTHSTNGIIIQEKTKVSFSPIDSLILSGKKSKRRTLDPPKVDVPPYHLGKRCNPDIVTDIRRCKDNMYIKSANAKLLDSAFILCKLPVINNINFPGWTGFNVSILKDKSTPALSIIGYLPVLEANPTQISTVNAILSKSVDMADQLELDQVVLVFDQAIYAKAQQIRWKEMAFKKRLVIRLGEFHTSMAFLAVLGKRFKDAGLCNIMLESGIVAEGSINGVMTGKHYNRSIRAHKLVFEALSYLLWTTFFDSVPHDQYEQYLESVKNLHDLYKTGNLTETELPKILSKMTKEFDEFVSLNCENSVTFAFWISYLDMIGSLLRFVRATRTADWDLHLATVEEMIPWFFAYDRVNYARYLPVYLFEMLNLEKTHPSVHEKLHEGNFVAQRQNIYRFSGTAMDQVIEQTANRDSKTKGGLKGITRNPNAVHRWMLSHHLRAQISHSCENLAGKISKKRGKKDLDRTQNLKDEVMIKNILGTISSMINPFTWAEEGLVNISSGVLASNSIQKDLLTAKVCGNDAYKLYCDERLFNGSEIDIYSKISQQKLLTFSDTNRQVNLKTKLKTGILKDTNDILARIIVMGQTSSPDIKDVMSYNLAAYPPSIANPDGSIVKTNKAALMHSVLKSVGQYQNSIDIPENNALILDGMGVLQQMQNIPNTFGNLALHLLKYIINMAVSYKSKEVHFVTDTYPVISIKHSERQRRTAGGETVIKIGSSAQKTPNQFKKFLSNGSNKEALIEFLFKEWSSVDPGILKSVSLIVTHGLKCHLISSADSNLIVRDMPELHSDHEEADTRMLLHAANASKCFKHVLIKCSDTDVFILSLSMCKFLTAQLYLLLGTESNFQFHNISSIATILGPDICDSLVGLHIFTGCDSCSAFKGKGKIKAFNTMKSKKLYIDAFKEVGKSWTLSSPLIQTLEIFVCELYGQPTKISVNDARYVLFKLKFKIDVALPPNYDALLCHIKRVNYQACIHRRCFQNVMRVPNPAEHGWIIRDRENISICWNTIPCVPDGLLKNLLCTCQKTACLSSKCTCKSNGISCSELCSCTNCENSNEQNEFCNVTVETDSDIDDGLDNMDDFC